uniref:Uncharacterized protein n=1 Tax=Alexandrium catenella TaxID=2925 RepID=A0A7S1QUL7_ALECA
MKPPVQRFQSAGAVQRVLLASPPGTPLMGSAAAAPLSASLSCTCAPASASATPAPPGPHVLIAPPPPPAESSATVMVESRPPSPLCTSGRSTPLWAHFDRTAEAHANHERPNQAIIAEALAAASSAPCSAVVVPSSWALRSCSVPPGGPPGFTVTRQRLKQCYIVEAEDRWNLLPCGAALP